MLLFHGTAERAAEDVLAHQNGLDPRFSKGGFYGKGIYLAEDPSYPIGGRYAHRSPLGREPRAAAHREGRPRLAAGDEGDAHAGRAR